MRIYDIVAKGMSVKVWFILEIISKYVDSGNINNAAFFLNHHPGFPTTVVDSNNRGPLSYGNSGCLLKKPCLLLGNSTDICLCSCTCPVQPGLSQNMT